MINWIDLLIIILLVLFTLEGLGRSFIGEMLDFLSFLLAFLLSLRFYNEAAQIFQSTFQVSHSIANILGFIAVWFLIETFFFGLLHLLFRQIKPFSNLNKKLTPLAVIPAALRGLVFISILLVLIGTFPIQPEIKKAVQQSRVGSYILSKAHQLETPLKNVFGGITQDTLTFLTIKPRTNETVNLGFKTREFKPSQSLEDQMVTLVNQERIAHRLKPLDRENSLRQVGRQHSADMFERGYFSHYSPEGKNVADRAESNGVEFLVIGENLAYAPSLELAHNGLMNSAGHRANILSEDFGKVGIGIMDGGVYGLMITQVFSN